MLRPRNGAVLANGRAQGAPYPTPLSPRARPPVSCPPPLPTPSSSHLVLASPPWATMDAMQLSTRALVRHALMLHMDFGSAPIVASSQATMELRWSHIDHLLFEFPGVRVLDKQVTITLLRDDHFRTSSGPEHAEAVMLPAFPSCHVHVVDCCHGLSGPVPARPCCCPAPSPPLPHEITVF